MILIWLIALPFLGGLIAWLSECLLAKSARVISFLILFSGVILMLVAWHLGESSTSMEDIWLIEWRCSWMSAWGIEFHVGMDGLSFVLLLLTYVMGFFALGILKPNPNHHPGLFHFCMLWIVSGMAGVLLSLDLFLFFVCWEVVLIPLYLVVAIWGEKNRFFATAQFIIFTQVSGLLLLVSTLALVFMHYTETGVYTFDYNQLIETNLPYPYGFWILFGFLIAFLVKLPAFPFHVWMPPLFVEAPAAPLLVGILVKTGAYGLLRFVLPLFVTELNDVWPWMLVLGVISIVYGAILAFSQNNPQKVLAYMTISHMGIILIGIFSQDGLALSGVVVLLVAQALSTGGLLMLFSQLRDKTEQIDLKKMGGIFKVVPGITVLALFFIMASLGLPGLGNFVGEWLVLLGIFNEHAWIAVLASSGIVLGAVYLLWLVQQLFFGPYKSNIMLVDVSVRQKIGYGLMILLLVGIGLNPAPVLDVVSSTWQELASDSDELAMSKRQIKNHKMKIGEST